ncbi:hypothetical protein LTR66_008226 [Elasticomyces elasticus]|nr:hypothetical protein LTR28_004583 [Elasticomyces elasticus]KAK4985278.1 hypothetical protein LTR66_008226 [Elasticomyces elasticus]KAK4987228.1 hypothetical protein LTR50_004740 [Elasticomyces elasticus]
MSETCTVPKKQDGSKTRGTKRHADDSLDDEQRFAKRFNLLNLDQNSRLYIPVPAQGPDPAYTPVLYDERDEHMRLDDTKDRVYIHDLDEELAEIESEDEKVVFLPDIEKRISKIPKHVLTGRNPESEGQELVLYGVPASLTVPEEHDSVRKAILEARERARKVQLQDAAAARSQISPSQAETAHGYSLSDYEMDGAPPAMQEMEETADPDEMDLS